LFTCHGCGEKIQRQNAKFCPQCQAPLNPEEYQKWLEAGNKPMLNGWVPPVPPASNKPDKPENEGGENSMKPNDKIIAAAILILVVMFAVIGIMVTYNSLFNRNTAPTNQVAAAADSLNSTDNADKTMALNEKTSLDPLDMPLWDEYYKAGVQVTDSGDVWYAQSGKDGTNRLQGRITKDQILVLDCYTLIKEGTKYDGGNLLMLRGPVDFDNYEIYYNDGAAQLVDPDHAQELLDYNIAVKFARGDWDSKKNQFSYKRWALTNLWTLDYDYHTLVGKLNAANDTYPK
jgi:hypothetical protein